MFRREAYATDYAGATVLDIGAHKGYYGAYALERGARRVVSYEPESQNFAALEAAARSYGDWRAERVGVGGREGELELVVSASSWAHSLLEESGAARDAVRRERVTLVAAERVLHEAAVADSRVIVKLNVEGAECDVVLGTPPEAWSAVDEVFVEVHSFARCTAEDITAHLAGAGLVLATRSGPTGFEVLRLTRR